MVHVIKVAGARISEEEEEEKEEKSSTGVFAMLRSSLEVAVAMGCAVNYKREHPHLPFPPTSPICSIAAVSTFTIHFFLGLMVFTHSLAIPPDAPMSRLL